MAVDTGNDPRCPSGECGSISEMQIFRINGLDCGDCAAKLEQRLQGMAGVARVMMNFGGGLLTVQSSLSEKEIIMRIKESGYGAVAVKGSSSEKMAVPLWWQESKAQIAIFSGVMFMMALLVEFLSGKSPLALLFYGLATVGGMAMSVRSAWYSLKAGMADMNVLMTIAVLGAVAIDQWSEGAAVAVLFSLGGALQAYTMDKTRQSIRNLMDLAPGEATLLRDGKEEIVPVEEIRIGDRMLIRPGEKIPLDGRVVRGRSAVNQAVLTGESLPVDKTAGDPVYAGCVNDYGLLEVEVDHLAGDSALGRILHMVEEAQGKKAPFQQLVDRFSRYYTPVVLVMALLVMILPVVLFSQPFIPWFYKGLVLLVISCPCALVISTPVSIVAAIGAASRQGVLIKGGAHLERIGGLKAMAFDKTGTLTHGNPVMTDLVSWHDEEEKVWEMAAAVEQWSEHPLARAIVAAASGRELKISEGFQALPGLGAQASVDGVEVLIGNWRLFQDRKYPLTNEMRQEYDIREQQGKTVMLVGVDGQVAGLIAVADTLREECSTVLEELRLLGIEKILMLTGDNRQVAEAVAAHLGLDAIHSELLPGDKLKIIEEIDHHQGVVMIGDGINDAPALAAASVGVAMGGAVDAALETADVVVMADDLRKLSYLVALSRRTMRVIRQNIVFSLGIKAVFLALTLGGMTNLWMAVFADTGASLLVTLNGMRLMWRDK